MSPVHLLDDRGELLGDRGALHLLGGRELAVLVVELEHLVVVHAGRHEVGQRLALQQVGPLQPAVRGDAEVGHVVAQHGQVPRCD